MHRRKAEAGKMSAKCNNITYQCAQNHTHAIQRLHLLKYVSKIFMVYKTDLYRVFNISFIPNVSRKNAVTAKFVLGHAKMFRRFSDYFSLPLAISKDHTYQVSTLFYTLT